METILAIFGAACLLVVVAAGIGILVIRAKLRKFGQELTENIVAMGASSPPIALRLEKADAPVWMDQAKKNACSSELAALGFAPAGEYFIANLPNTLIAGFADPMRGYWACLTEHPMGFMVDFLVESADDRTIMVGDNENLRERDTPESFAIKVAQPIPLMYTVFQQHRPAEVKPIDPTQFAEVFMRLYRQSMERQYLSKSFDLSYLDDLDHLPNRGLDDETFAFLKAHGMVSDPAISVSLRKAYMDKVTAGWWEDHEHRLAFIHDKLMDEDLIEVVDAGDAEGSEKFPDALEEFAGLGSRARFWAALDKAGLKDNYELHETMTEGDLVVDVVLGPE